MSILYAALFLSLSKNDQFSAFDAIEGKTQEVTADRGLTHLFSHPLSHCARLDQSKSKTIFSNEHQGLQFSDTKSFALHLRCISITQKSLCFTT